MSRKCVLFPHCPCLSCSLFLAFLSLDVCFSPIAHVVLLTFSHLLSSSDLTQRFGMRAFLKHGTAVNCSPFKDRDE
ncbi:hypothetical protein B0H14DRAFT_2876915, partial [Mycena olivaceomarginata]